MSTPPHGSPPWPPPFPGSPPWPPPGSSGETGSESGSQPGSQPPRPYPGGQPQAPYPGDQARYPGSGGDPSQYPGAGPSQYPYGTGSWPGAAPTPYGQPASPPVEAQNAYWAARSGQGYPPQGLGGPGEPGRDPRAPIGGHVPASVSIRQYSAESSRKPVFITLAVLLVVAVAVWWGVRTANQDPPLAAPSVVPTTPQPSGSGNADANAIPFDNGYDNAHGIWTIDSYAWSGPRVVLKMTVQVTAGQQVLQFFAFTNADTSQAYEPRPSGRPDDLLGQVVQAGQTVTGTVTFQMPDSESTVFLLDSSGRQVTALIVPA